MRNPRGTVRGSRRLLRLTPAVLAVTFFVFSSAIVLRHWRAEHLLSVALQSPEPDGRQAEDLLRQALRHGNDTAAVELARLSYNRREWKDFHEYADKALELNPGRGYVYMLRAYALTSERPPGSPDEAEKIIGECRRAVSVDPVNGNLWLRYAELSFRVYRHLSRGSGEEGAASGYREESRVAYGRALRLDRESSGKALEDLLALGGDPSFVVSAFHDASPAALRRVAAVLLDNGDWESLREKYLEGAADSEARRNAYRAAAHELRSRRLHGEVLAALQDYPFAEREDAILSYLAGRSAEILGPENGHWDTADRYYRTAVQLDPANGTFRKALGALESKVRAAER